MSDTAGQTGSTTPTPAAPAATPAAPAAPAPAAPATPAAATPPAPATPAPGQQPGEQQPAAATTSPIPGVDTTGWPQAAIDAYNARDSQAKTYQQEAGDRRVQFRDFVKNVAPALGIDLPDDGPVDARALREQMATEVATERREAAVALAAAQHGVPADRLDFLAFKIGRNADAQGLDTTASDFRAKMSAIVLGEIQNDATLVGTGAQPQVSSVPGVVGNDNGGAVLTLDAFKSMSMQERMNLYNTDRATYDSLASQSY